MVRWFIGFCIIFLAGFLPFAWMGYAPLIAGIPLWYLYTALLYLIFFVVYKIFVKNYWEKHED